MKFVVILAASMTLFACKPKNEKGGAKSVDAVETGDLSIRNNMQCGKNGNLDSVESALKSARTALPSEIQKFYRESNTIQAIPNVAQRCYKILNKEKEQAGLQFKISLSDIQGCWRVNKDGGKPSVEVFLEADPQKIHDNILTLTTYGAVELYLDGVLGKTINSITQEQVKSISENDANMMELYKQFSSSRDEFAAAVFADLESRGLSGSLLRYKEIFGDNYKTSPMLKTLFIAEFTDSYFCNKDTRKDVNNTRFPTASAKFEKIAEMFGSAWWQ